MQGKKRRKRKWRRKPWEFYEVSRTTWWRWERDGRVPQGIKIGPNTKVWDAEETERKLIGSGTDAAQEEAE